MLSAQPLDRLVDAEAATWIDRELVSAAPEPARDAGFGHDLRDAQARRHRWLVAQGFAEEAGGATTFPNGMIAALQRRELLRVAEQLSDDLKMPFREAAEGGRVEGAYRRTDDLVSGRFALSMQQYVEPGRRARAAVRLLAEGLEVVIGNLLVGTQQQRSRAASRIANPVAGLRVR